MLLNTLCYGDNLKVLSEHVGPCLRGPHQFNRNAAYNVLFAEHSGEKDASPMEAFEDTWNGGQESARTAMSPPPLHGTTGSSTVFVEPFPKLLFHPHPLTGVPETHGLARPKRVPLASGWRSGPVQGTRNAS